MAPPQTNRSSEADNLIVTIVEKLRTHGRDPDEYELYETLDAAIAERLIAESDDTVEIQFTIDGLRLAVTSERVTVLSDNHEVHAD